MSVNKVTLLGNVGQDPELKYLPSGIAVLNLSVATNEKWEKNGQLQEKTEWHRIVIFGKLAEVCNQYLKKGSKVYLEGKLQTRSWDDQQGSKHYATEIIASNVQFLSSRGSGSSSQSDDSTPDSSFAADDIPF